MSIMLSHRSYKRITVNSVLSPELIQAIDAFMYHINNESGFSEDCYRSEIEFWLKDSYEKLPADQYEALKDYYVLGGIYTEYGYPWEYKTPIGK